MSSTTLTCISDKALSSSLYPAFGSSARFMPLRWENYAGVFMSFSVPEILKSKKITGAILHICVAPQSEMGADEIIGHTEGTAYYSGGTITAQAYTATDNAEALSYSNYRDYGSLVGNARASYGEVRAVGKNGGAAVSYTTTWTSIDITDIFKNNVYSNHFTAVCTAPGVSVRKESPEGYYEGTVNAVNSIISREGSNSPYITVEYDDIVPTNDTLYPNGSYINQNTDVEFVWSFNSSSGTALAHSKVEWSTNQSTWNTIYDADGNATSYKAVGVRFPAGRVYWRITTTDNLGVSASPSVASWTVMAAPEAPVILGATQNARPIITWNASSQMAYSIGIYQNGVLKESEEVAKRIKSYTCKEFYAPTSNIEIRLKVMNQYELWSDEVSRVITFNMETPAQPSIFVSVNGANVEIVPENSEDSEGAELFLFRYDYDSEISVNLGSVESGSRFIDNYAPSGKRIGYFARAVLGGYRDSNAASAVLTIPGINLYCDGETLNLELSTEAFMPLDDKHGRDSALAYYSGREYPCREVGTKRSHEITRTFFIPEADFPTLARMAVSDEPIIYKDNRGNVMLATLVSDLSAAAYQKNGYVIEVTFEQIEEA